MFWSNIEIKAYGLFITDYLIELYKGQAQQVITNVDRLINAWKKRGFNVVGNQRELQCIKEREIDV